MCQELRIWALEHLVNSILEKPKLNDASFAQNYEISFPLKELSARR